MTFDNPTELSSEISPTSSLESAHLEDSVVVINLHVKTPPLTEEHKQILEQLKNEIFAESLLQNSAYLRHYCTDRVLHQFLRARSFDLQKSKKLLMLNLEWRLKYKPDLLLASDPDIELNADHGKIMTESLDQYGRPILLMDGARGSSKQMSNESQIKHVFFQLERAKQLMKGDVEKYCLFINNERYSFRNSPPFSVTLEISKTLTDRYVEHLGHAIMWQPPSLFMAMFTAVKPFLDPKTLSKIKFIKGDTSPGSENDRIMTQVVGPDWRIKCQLTELLPEMELSPGEKSNSNKKKGELYKYDHSTFWSRVIKEQQEYLQTNLIPIDDNASLVKTAQTSANSTPVLSPNKLAVL